MQSNNLASSECAWDCQSKLCTRLRRQLLCKCKFGAAASVATRCCTSAMSFGSAASLKSIFCLFCVAAAWATVIAAHNSPVFEDCLLDLRLSELLRLKHSLTKISDQQETSASRYKNVALATQDAAEQSCERPMAMALEGRERSYANPAPSYHAWQPEEKPSKLQTLFQVSITALAFLSFGGYLLCLIVQAIKSKGTTYFHPVATATTTTINGGVKRIKIYRRSRRELETPARDALLISPYALHTAYGNGSLISPKV